MAAPSAFRWPGGKLEPFTVRISIDPETVEYSIKPVPLVWLYDDRFVHFLQHLVWEVPMKGSGLAPSVAHGGCQFSFSAKTFMGGSLLADAIAYRVNHPEVCLFLMDWPNPDDRALRATPRRLAAFRGQSTAPRSYQTARLSPIYWSFGGSVVMR